MLKRRNLLLSALSTFALHSMDISRPEANYVWTDENEDALNQLKGYQREIHTYYTQKAKKSIAKTLFAAGISTGISTGAYMISSRYFSDPSSWPTFICKILGGVWTSLCGITTINAYRDAKKAKNFNLNDKVLGWLVQLQYEKNRTAFDAIYNITSHAGIETSQVDHCNLLIGLSDKYLIAPQKTPTDSPTALAKV